MTEFEEKFLTLFEKLNNTIDLLLSNGFAQSSSFLSLSETTCKYTLFDWLDEWFKTYKAERLADKGYKMQLSINKHIKLNIENKPLNKLEGIDIQKALNEVKSGRMQKIVHSIYNMALDKACKLNIIKNNPMISVDTVKYEGERGRALTIQEHKEFLVKAKQDNIYNLFRFYLLTGCRKNEALRVKWEDVRDGHLFINGTKTKNANRSLPIFPQLKKLLDIIPKTNVLIFPFSDFLVRHHFDSVRAKLSFKDITIHDLRHTFATRCLESGVSMKSVQKWLGHSKYSTTADIYSHVNSAYEKEEIDKFNANVICLKSDR